VLTPNIFYRTSKSPVFDFEADFRNERTQARFRELTAPLTPAAMARDASAYVDILSAQPNVSSVKPVPHLGSGSRSRPRLVEEMRMKRASNEKEPRLLTVSRLRRNNTSRHSNGNKVPRLPQPITARPMDNRKVERSNQKKRHRHIRNNFAQQHQRLRDVKTPEPFF
jgi:hypothetical protein